MEAVLDILILYFLAACFWPQRWKSIHILWAVPAGSVALLLFIAAGDLLFG